MKLTISVCRESKTKINYETHYYCGEYSKWAGSEYKPYTDVLKFDFNKEKHRKVFKHITMGYVHAPFSYKGGARSNATLNKAYAILFDFDGKADKHDDWTIDEWKASDIAKKFNHVGYTSKSHTQDCHCFHILIPLATPITDAEMYKRVRMKLIEEFGVKNDPAVKDAARLFNPARKSGEKANNPYYWMNRDGETLDVSLYIEQVKKEMQEEEEMKAKLAQEMIERRQQAKVVKARKGMRIEVDGKFLKNYEGQLDAILIKRAGHPELDSFIDMIFEELIDDLSISEYDQWISAGHAIKRFAGEAGRSAWNRLCDNGGASKGDYERYDTFKSTQDYIIQPIYKIARDNGYSVSIELAQKIIGWDRALRRDEELDQDVKGMDAMYKAFTEDKKLSIEEEVCRAFGL